MLLLECGYRYTGGKGRDKNAKVYLEFCYIHILSLTPHASSVSPWTTEWIPIVDRHPPRVGCVAIISHL